MVRRMPYVQQWKGSYRFRRRVPDHLKPIIGKPEWVAALGTKDKAEANRLVVPHIGRTDQIISDAERGDYPPLPPDHIEPIAFDWWRWFCQERAKLLNVGAGLVSNGLDPHLWALTGEKELTDLLARFVAEKGLDYRPGSGPFDRIKQRCREIHHETAYGYRSEIDDRMAAANQIWDAADDQLAALKNGGPLEGRPPQAVNRPPNLAPIGTAYKFSTLIAEWARERKAQDKTKYGFEKIITKLSKHLGHDDAAAVTDTDLISWKESLIESDLSPKTIKNHLLVVKTLFKFAKANKKIATNVAAEVSYQARTDPRGKRLRYSDEDARRILIAARGETEPHLRWVPWLACFTGARLEELVGAMVRDVETIQGVPCLHIRLDYRPRQASLKNENSARTVPLHPAIVAEGFLDYIKTLPSNGPLFPNLAPDRFGKRAGTGTKRIGRWIRGKTVGITDTRIAPSHSWRHRFETKVRDLNIREDISNRLTGRRGAKPRRDFDESEASDSAAGYGAFEIGTLARAIARLKNPAVEPIPS